MTKLLVALFPLLVVVPHLIPLDVHGSWNNGELRKVDDTGQKLPSQERMESLLTEDPVAFLEYCLLRYEREVQGYTTVLHKQERLHGRLEKPEIIQCWFREKPFSVLMDWKSGQRLVKRSLYVEGENKGLVVVKPAGVAGLVGLVGDGTIKTDPGGEEASRTSRYKITEFGMKVGMERSLSAWTAAQKANTLHIEYLGRKKVEDLGGRECWVLRRYPYAEPEVDGVAEQIAYVDCENWLMLGTVLKGTDGKLIGEYLSREVRLNPKFDVEQFTPKMVAK